MTPEDWQRVKPILDSALQLDSAQRPAFLKQACADPSLRHEVESLIAAHEQAGTNALNSAPLLRTTLTTGTKLGDFQILALLGSGGMGEVYRAVFMRAQHPEAAFGKFQEPRAIYKSLFDAGFGSAFHGACTAECSEKMREASALTGNAQAAADYFHQAATIAERLVSANSGDVNALHVAADANSGLGDLSFKKARQRGQTASLRKANWAEARSWYAKSLAAWHRIEHPNRSAMNGFDVGDPAPVAKNLHQSEAALARFGALPQ